jgi:tRNA(fMet)-specific endonuclease VapC
LKQRFPALDRRMRPAMPAGRAALSAITRAELLYGQALLPADAGERHDLIDAFLEDMPVLAWDRPAADA